MASIKSIFVNLPVHDIARTRNFWNGLGFSFNEQFSNNDAVCLVLNEGSIYAMLVSHAFFKTFTPRPIADGSTTQVLLAIEVDSREQVDDMVKKALAQGATRYMEPVDYGWMYYDRFVDLDGHQWEVLTTDYSKFPQA